MFMELTGVRAVTLSADLDVRTFGRTNYFSHFTDLFFDFMGIFRDCRRHVFHIKKLLRVNFTVTDKLIIDVAEETTPNLYSGFVEDPRLKGQIRNVNVLQSGGGFDLNDVPFVFADRIQDVGTGEATVGRKRGLENRAA